MIEEIQEPEPFALPLEEFASRSTHRVELPQYPVSLTATEDPALFPRDEMTNFTHPSTGYTALNERLVNGKRERSEDEPSDAPPQPKFLRVAERRSAKRKRFTQSHIEWQQLRGGALASICMETKKSA